MVTGAVVLGTQGRSWTLQGLALAGAWILLFLVQVWVLTGASSAYISIAQQEEASLVVRLFFQALHPTVIILPLVLAVLWLLMPYPRQERRLAIYVGPPGVPEWASLHSLLRRAP